MSDHAVTELVIAVVMLGFLAFLAFCWWLMLKASR